MGTTYDINKLNVETLKRILEACDKTFTTELGLKTTDVGQIDWKISEIGFSYKKGDELSKKNFLIYLEKLTDTKNVRLAYAKIYEEVENRTKEASRPEEQEKTTLNKDEIKQLQEVQAAKETLRKETIVKSKERVDEAIARKQEIKTHQDLLNKKIEESKKIEVELKDSSNQNKKVYVKVNVNNPPKFTNEEQAAFDVYKNEIKTNPKEAFRDLSKTIEERITPELIKQGVDVEEIKLVSDQTATKIVENIIPTDTSLYVSPMTQAAILGEISKDTKVLPKILTDKETLNIFQNSVNDIAATTAISDGVSKNITKLAFGETFASTVFGSEPNQITVTLSETPEPEYNNSIDFYNLNQNYQNSLIDQNSTLETIKDLGTSKTKAFLYKKVGTYLESRVANLSPQSIFGKLLQSTEAKSLFFSTFGVGSPVTWESTNWVGNIALKFAPESAPILSGISKLTGINFGIAPTAVTAIDSASVIGATVVEASPVIGTLAAEGIVQTGAQVAAPVVAKVAGGLLPKIFAALGTVGGWVTFGISTIVGLLLGKLLEKINWKKLKENFLPVAAIGGGLLIGGPVGLSLIGGGLFATKAARKALKTGSFFARLGTVFGGIAITIATPVIITLLIIPPTVAFFMFIINSGAYMVPPSSLTLGNIINPYIEITKTPVPPGPFKNSDLPLTVEYEITIKAKKGVLENIHLNYECGVVKAGPKVNCPPTNPTVPSTLENIQPGDSFSFKYSQSYQGGTFKDSLIVDTITITADTSGQTNVKSSASAGVKIGNPPDDCPSIWPVDSGKLTQTPDGNYSHRGVEAIDVSIPVGTKVKATHSGVATVYDSNTGYGKHVMITSVCGGKIITTVYAHLVGFSVSNGEVLLGQMIGASGSTGNSSGPHLHYEFKGGLQMVPPFIPKTIKRGCSNDNVGCGYIP